MHASLHSPIRSPKGDAVSNDSSMPSHRQHEGRKLLLVGAHVVGGAGPQLLVARVAVWSCLGRKLVLHRPVQAVAVRLRAQQAAFRARSREQMLLLAAVCRAGWVLLCGGGTGVCDAVDKRFELQLGCTAMHVF